MRFLIPHFTEVVVHSIGATTMAGTTATEEGVVVEEGIQDTEETTIIGTGIRCN